MQKFSLSHQNHERRRHEQHAIVCSAVKVKAYLQLQRPGGMMMITHGFDAEEASAIPWDHDVLCHYVVMLRRETAASV